ncbi:hypothetical protein ON010_g938 [Phytophthora cinnamomi]|nr:hypothetical protein ON010_g938 [Phytophthora cinnamomi]
MYLTLDFSAVRRVSDSRSQGERLKLYHERNTGPDTFFLVMGRRTRGAYPAVESAKDSAHAVRERRSFLQASLGSSEDQSLQDTVHDSPRNYEYWKDVAVSERQRCEVSKSENERLKSKLKRNKKRCKVNPPA